MPIPDRLLTTAEVHRTCMMLASVPTILGFLSPSLRSIAAGMVASALSYVFSLHLLRRFWGRNAILLGSFFAAGALVGSAFGWLAGESMSACALTGAVVGALLGVLSEPSIRVDLAIGHLEALQAAAADAELRHEATLPDIRYLPVDDKPLS